MNGLLKNIEFKKHSFRINHHLLIHFTNLKEREREINSCRRREWNVFVLWTNRCSSGKSGRRMDERNYWKQGNGESSIEVDEDWETESLVFFYHEPYGFFLMRYPDFLVPFKKVEKIETIKHVVAGAPLYVPSCSYVDRHQAYEIVQHFLKTKSVPDSVEWVELRTIDFQQDL